MGEGAGGLRAFLEVLQEPRYRRIVIADGPAVLGYERYREQEERTTFGIVQEIVSSVLASYDLEPSMVETFSRVFFGAMSAPGAAVSTAEDPAPAGAEVEAAIGYILAGLRAWPSRALPLPRPCPCRPGEETRTTGPRGLTSAGGAEDRGGLLLDDDEPAVLRHQLDPGVPGGQVSAPALVLSVIVEPSDFFQVPRTTCPPWKTSALPVPVNFVSGTRLPAGSR